MKNVITRSSWVKMNFERMFKWLMQNQISWLKFICVVTFICDFIFSLKLCEANLFTMYCEDIKGFLHNTLVVSKIFVSTSMNTCVWHGGKSLPHALNLLPFLGGELYMLCTHDLITKEVMNFITKQVLVDCVESLKH